ncbi:MAG: ATP-grasp domain-containing protein [Planctomycetaceae bacterium]|nr:ATP-grasp domain-containing protein [Planctomycetaceae bacterium]
MRLIYDLNDVPFARKLKDDRLQWLRELGAVELADVQADERGFLFSYEHGPERLCSQVGALPSVHDRPDERRELVNLNDVLEKLSAAGISIPTPKTWVMEVDEEIPADLKFPLFVRTLKSSWKRGGGQGRVGNLRELYAEAELLRRAFGWDTPIIAREWLDIASAGKWMFGDAPQEIRTWVVDGTPVAWSFHYLHVISSPAGFPPAAGDLRRIEGLASAVARPFSSRLVAADFVRDTKGDWHFMEAGPGAVAGTAHERVFKHVARTLSGAPSALAADDVGGPF